MSGIEVRVMVEDAWDQVTLDLPSTTTVIDVKRKALTLTHRTRDPGEYLVKFRGAEIDESRSLAESGVVTRASLIVLPRNRRPVR